MNLNERQQYVLWATVRHYIATAEPVGSKTLVDEYNLSVSPATIRNAMGWLEKAGLLYQPHTSAGRIPSDSGYRIYVDKLIKPDDGISRQVEQALSDRLKLENWAFEAVLQRGFSNLGGPQRIYRLNYNASDSHRLSEAFAVNPDRTSQNHDCGGD